MVQAYVMIDIAAGTVEDVLSEIQSIEAVTEAHVVAGDFDVIAEVQGEVVRDILITVTREIRPLDGVGTTKSYICLD